MCVRVDEERSMEEDSCTGSGRGEGRGRAHTDRHCDSLCVYMRARAHYVRVKQMRVCACSLIHIIFLLLLLCVG
jgi:hypothetical protein